MADISRNHGTVERTTTETIVVGFDESRGSEQALRWAAAEARSRGARLRVVLAWEAPPQLVAGAGWVPPDAARLEELGTAAKARLDAALGALAPVLGAVDVEARVEHGPATSVLVEAARDAALLVVGTRGHGEVAGLLLGSVGQHVTTHAPCSVVVVRDGR